MAFDRSRPTVIVGGGCCCGTADKHLDIDHDAELESLRHLVDGVADFRVTECVGPCERSNVVLVAPSRYGHRTVGRPTWLGFVLGVGMKEEIAGWLCNGGPGLAEIPTPLASHCFERRQK
ncbi:hypothetical protein CH260_15605 [Rhodococcus sp. 05-2256-B2]|nr:hypothetical protein CH258_20945 [Rhodococcus sp. 05-2256-B4]OZD87365.1 hypothetical protein CH257_25275 [Rhodococcus sp. 05-2256-B3]OZD94849.1 hypothetical protein CH260_15605 [Rhodococcus sp. 05-2256-B2]OZE07899.1 hypothetical protein CH285_04020 [Rhodococcus sp. 05-2256-B1]